MMFYAALLACNMMDSSVGCMAMHDPKAVYKTEAECKAAVDTALEQRSHDPVGRAFLYMPGAVLRGGCLERDADWKFEAKPFFERYGPQVDYHHARNA